MKSADRLGSDIIEIQWMDALGREVGLLETHKHPR